MKLIVGLGNPGSEYARNRHNVGFMVIDELLRRWGGSTASKFRGDWARVQVGQAATVLLKPMTFMNRSGESVGACARYFDVDTPGLVVIHDELDIPFGDLRIKTGGGHAGHNGLRSIMQHQGGGDFVRVRVGIGRPRHGSPADHVLSDFSGDETIDLDDLIGRAADAAEVIVRDGARAAMNQFNRRGERAGSSTPPVSAEEAE